MIELENITKVYKAGQTEIPALRGMSCYIESGEMDVDDLTSKVKRASVLLDICNKKLRKTEEELDKIVEDIE